MKLNLAKLIEQYVHSWGHVYMLSFTLAPNRKSIVFVRTYNMDHTNFAI